MLAALVVIFLGTGIRAQAAISWDGQDFGGADFVPGDGDTLKGAFTGIKTLIISEGITIYGDSERVSLSADEIIIDGALKGSSLSWAIDLVARYDITLKGTLSEWTGIFLAADACYIGSDALIQVNTINDSGVTLTSGGVIESGNNGGVIDIGDSLILDSAGQLTLGSDDGTIGSISLPPGSQIDLGNTLADLQAVPIPSSMCLLILGLALLRIVRQALQPENFGCVF